MIKLLPRPSSSVPPATPTATSASSATSPPRSIFPTSSPWVLSIRPVKRPPSPATVTPYACTPTASRSGFVPGGTRIKMSGTSMASPNVVNLAAKLIALDATLTPEQTIALVKKGADTNPRRTPSCHQPQSHRSPPTISRPLTAQPVRCLRAALIPILSIYRHAGLFALSKVRKVMLAAGSERSALLRRHTLPAPERSRSPLASARCHSAKRSYP